MQIDIFNRGVLDWIFVTGRRPIAINPSPDQPVEGYEAHWSAQESWSSTSMAMTFPSREKAEQYLEANRDRMMEAL